MGFDNMKCQSALNIFFQVLTFDGFVKNQFCHHVFVIKTFIILVIISYFGIRISNLS